MTDTQSRVHTRYQYEQPLELRTRGRLLPGTAVNLAVGGLCIRTDAVVNAGEFVRIYLPLKREERAGSRFCAVDGRIAWRSDDCCGVAFADIPRDTLRQVADYIESLPIASRARAQGG